jgi:hypothetical protein
MPEEFSEAQRQRMQQILQLRLIVCRAAATDALHWWDDESLTEAGLTLAQRVFAHSPDRLSP